MSLLGCAAACTAPAVGEERSEPLGVEVEKELEGEGDGEEEVEGVLGAAELPAVGGDVGDVAGGGDGDGSLLQLRTDDAEREVLCRARAAG